MKIRRVCVLGGTGFVGHPLVCRLASSGRMVRVLSRHPQRHRDFGVLPQVDLQKADIHDRAQLTRHFAGCDCVVNLAGILNERNRDGQRFRDVHVALPRKVMTACQNAGVQRLLHMSALNADAGRGTSLYLRTKGEAEDLLHVEMSTGLAITRFRPSVIFGPGDSFFNRFRDLLKLSPVIFPLACARTRFAPVYVGDVAEAFMSVLEDPRSFDQRYDLCGPNVYTLRELVQYTARIAGLKRYIMPLGKVLSQLQAIMLEFVPGKPFSYDNYLSLQVDSICQHNDFVRLGIEPLPLEAIVPAYLSNQNTRAHLDDLRMQARR